MAGAVLAQEYRGGARQPLGSADGLDHALSASIVGDRPDLLEVRAEGLQGRVRGEVHPEALHVQSGRARLLHERLRRGQFAPKAEDPLAQSPEVPVAAVGCLLGRGLHRDAGRIGGPERRLVPYPGVDRHAAPVGDVEPVVDEAGVDARGPPDARLGIVVPLRIVAGEASHHKGPAEAFAELHHQLSDGGLGAPRPRASGISEVPDCYRHRARDNRRAVIGTLLSGRFRLEEQVGSGGMSTVYRAFDETLERWVAIKLLHRSMSDDSVQLERFRREARTVARLSHPHVVTVIDAGEDGGTPYIVFEYVEGETLKGRIKRCGPLPVVGAVGCAIRIGAALMAAHSHRLAHRDVKPQNVLIDPDGRAKVTDFGISRSLDGDTGLTATGRVLGTTDYVAPEQALGEEVTEQSDLYSLGICLFEMLTGDVPFSAESQVGVAMKHVRDPLPNIQELRPEISSALCAVIERATAKETRNRYATAAEMVADLERALQIEAGRAGGTTNGEASSILSALPPGTADFAPPSRRFPFGLVAILLAVLAVAGAAAYLVVNTDFGSGGEDTTKAAAPAPLHSAKLIGADHFDPFGSDREEHSYEVRN